MMTKLNESGLLTHDLDYLILPLIEIDTFESKISNSKAIVLAFYVFDEDPAKDLERFIEKSSVTILDAETSSAPTEDGYYVTFIELDRDRNFPEYVMKIIEEINNLTNVNQWQFKTVHDATIHDLNEKNLRKYVNLDPATVPPSEDDIQDEIKDKKEKEAEEKEQAEKSEEEPELKEFIVPMLKHSLVESIGLHESTLFLNLNGQTRRYNVLYASITEPSVPIVGFNIGNPLINESIQLSKKLGPEYQVESVDNGLLVSSNFGYLILEPLD